MFREYKVKDVMDTELLVASPEESIKKIAEKMRDRDASEAIIVEDKKVRGIVTLRDIVYGVASGAKLRDPVLEIMTTELITADMEENLVDAVKKMRKYDVGRLPVVDRNNNLVGIISEKTLIRTFPALIELVYEEAEISSSQTAVPEETEFQEGVCEACGNYSEMLREKNGMWLCQECWEEEE